ncbi:hypothetical protein Cgig2_003269 [Carnegiea gigantea]|uniref:Uncharacterized protein n=1 Tax=Carnegiea gigantea TaxID=171969 RepID=A0A9Q1GRU6_9CARY|nr:hypothetical protein Cgig2_003269 [Carnegiea gigantea]
MSSFPTFQDATQAAEFVRDTFRCPLREFTALHPKLLPLNLHSLCPNFDLLVGMQFAYTAHIPEMVQAIFYTMMLNETIELGLSSKAVMDRMMLDLQELKWDIMEVRRMAKIKSTAMMRSPDELLAEGTIEANPRSVPSSSGPVAEVVSINTSSSSNGTPSRSSDGPSRSSSS